MAKTKGANGKVNKSQTIRDFVRDNPKLSNIEISEALTKQGVKVSAAFVSVVKSKAKLGGKKRRGRRPGRKAQPQLQAAAGSDNNALRAAVQLVRAAGSIEGARAALATVDQVSRLLP